MHDRLPPYVTLTPASPCFHVNCIPLKATFGDLPHCLKPLGLRSPYFNTNYIFLSKTQTTILLSHQKILSETFTCSNICFQKFPAVFHFPLLFLFSLLFLFPFHSPDYPRAIPCQRGRNIWISQSVPMQICKFPQFLV